MPPSESELIAVRLSRMKTLVEALEDACVESTEQHQNFVKLKRELEAVRAAIQPAPRR